MLGRFFLGGWDGSGWGGDVMEGFGLVGLSYRLGVDC